MEKNFGYLGFDFQQTLIKTIIEDKKYAEQIIELIESKYFENALVNISRRSRYVTFNLRINAS